MTRHDPSRGARALVRRPRWLLEAEAARLRREAGVPPAARLPLEVLLELVPCRSTQLLEEGVWALCGAVRGVPTVWIDAVVWRASAADEGRARHTVAHEVAHAVLHAEELRQGLDLHAEARRCHPEWSADWQADAWAGAILCPLDQVRDSGLTVEDVATRFGISLRAAEVRLRLAAG